MIEDPITPREFAALLVSWIEGQGGVFSLDHDDTFRLDLNPIRDMDYKRADAISHAVLGVRDEVRQVLLSQRIQH